MQSRVGTSAQASAMSTYGRVRAGGTALDKASMSVDARFFSWRRMHGVGSPCTPPRTKKAAQK